MVTARAEYKQNVTIAGVLLSNPIENDTADVNDVIVIDGIAFEKVCSMISVDVVLAAEKRRVD